MGISDPATEERLRQGFKYFNRFMLSMWRLGLGGMLNMWPDVTGRIMVITHTGRKSGAKRQTPVNYALIDGELYCTAGFGHQADWYRNIQANSQVEVWLPDGWYEGEAEDITDSAENLTIMREVLIGSGVVASLFGIQPKTMSDEDLARLTEEYRLIHIHCTAPRTGSGGPGDMAWVWPVATFLLLPLALRRKR